MPPTLPNLTDKKVLLIRNDKRIGNLLILSPCIHALVQTFPSATFDLLASTYNQEVMEAEKGLRRIWLFDKKDIPGIPGLLLKLRREHYDIAINFSAGSKTAELMLPVLGIKTRIACGRSTPMTRFVHHIVLPEENPPVLHLELQTRAKLAKLGVPPDFLDAHPYHLPLREEACAAVAQRFPRVAAKRVCFFIGNVNKNESRWPEANFVQLASLLLEHFPDMEIAIMAGREEMPLLTAFDAIKNPRLFFVTGTSLHESGAFLASCNLLVASSTGPAHLAHAVGCPVCSLMTHAQDAYFRPLGTGNIEVFGKSADRVHAIEVEDVFAGVKRLLG